MGAPIAPVKAAAQSGNSASGTTGVVYSAFKITAGTVSVGAWSLCWPYLQCSAQRLAESGSIAPAMSLQLGICAAIAAASGSLLASTCGAAAANSCVIGCICPIRALAAMADDNPGQAYAATVNCARNSTPAKRRASPRTKLRFMKASGTATVPSPRSERRRFGRFAWRRTASLSAGGWRFSFGLTTPQDSTALRTGSYAAQGLVPGCSGCSVSNQFLHRPGHRRSGKRELFLYRPSLADAQNQSSGLHRRHGRRAAPRRYGALTTRLSLPAPHTETPCGRFPGLGGICSRWLTPSARASASILYSRAMR